MNKEILILLILNDELTKDVSNHATESEEIHLFPIINMKVTLDKYSGPINLIEPKPRNKDKTKKEKFHYPMNKIHHDPERFEKYNLSCLNLNELNINSIEPYTFDSFKRLNVLRIEGNKIRNLNKDTFIGLDNLKELYLNFYEIELIDPYSFFYLKKLRVLELQNNKIKKLEKDIFIGLNNLYFLNLNNNQIELAEYKMFTHMNQLNEICLANNEIDNNNYFSLTHQLF